MNGDKKILLVSLHDMTHIPAIGGVGIHDLSKRNVAFGGKCIWHMYTKPQSTWYQIMKQSI